VIKPSEQLFHDIRIREMGKHASVLPTLYIFTSAVKKLLDKEIEEQAEPDFGNKPKPMVSTLFGIRVEYGGTEEECRELALIRQIQGERPTVVAL